MNHIYKNILIFLHLLTITHLYSDQLEFSIGNMKYDYNNLQLSYYGEVGDLKLDIGKLSLSTQNTGFNYNDTYEDLTIDIGPSRMMVQNLFVDFFDNQSRNHVKFDLGILKFDIINFNLNMIKGGTPNLNKLNAKFSVNDFKLDFSKFINLPDDAVLLLDQLGIKIEQFSINRANINTSYSQNSKLNFDLDAITSLASFKFNVIATINEKNPSSSNFQMFKITINNLSTEAKSVIGLLQSQSGFIMPMQNGSIVFDLKDMLNMRKNINQPK